MTPWALAAARLRDCRAPEVNEVVGVPGKADGQDDQIKGHSQARGKSLGLNLALLQGRLAPA